MRPFQDEWRKSARWRAAAAGGLAIALTAGTAAGGVTIFQHGAAPGPDYAGCTDTYIIPSGWAHDQPGGRGAHDALRSRALIRFDLTGLDANRPVTGAVLRLSCANVPSSPVTAEVFAMARTWEPTATWYEHAYLDGKEKEGNNWSMLGGDVDAGDFGKGSPGLIDRQQSRGGPFGHVIELDVTPVAAEWVAGKRPNHGLLVSAPSGSGTFVVTSSEWPIPAYRPMLLVEQADGTAAAEALRLPQAAGAVTALSPLASTANRRESDGPWTTIRLGRNATCQYRSGHMAGCAKQDPQYPGNWGWMPRLRVGGTAGDFNHALFHFDLSTVPKAAVIERATLRAFADVGNARLPAEMLGQSPPNDANQQRQYADAVRGRMGPLMSRNFGLFRIVGTGPGPGWDEETFTFALRRPGQPWPGQGGTLVAATEPSPVAVADVGKQWQAERVQRDRPPETWLEWDLTGLVRAWVQGLVPNWGVVLDHRLSGGELTLFSDTWEEPDRRPYLEVVLAPAPTRVADGPFVSEPIIPKGDYWLKSMRQAHARWKGIPGTFAQYGDSITVTMAFWTPLLYGDRKGITPEMQAALDTARRVIHKPCWRDWKGGQWGNTGNMTIAWCFDNIDAWQKKMNPEVAVILFGTNDAYLGPQPPVYTEKYAAVVNRCLVDGTIPIVTAPPPRTSQRGSLAGFMAVHHLRQAAIAVARAKNVPLIDLYAEMVARRPDDWDGRLEKFSAHQGYDVPTLIARDGIHPSNPKAFHNDWTEEGLKSSGFELRNYLTLKTWYDIYTKVLAPQGDGRERP